MITLDIIKSMHGATSLEDCIERMEALCQDLRAFETLDMRELAEPVMNGVIKLQLKDTTEDGDGD